jgi:hypothetical protein
MKESEWLSVCAEFDAMGESAVRSSMARGDWKLLPLKYECAAEWCRRNEEERSSAAAARAEAREEESLSISRKALSNSERATRIAISAIVLSIIMAAYEIIKWLSK